MAFEKEIRDIAFVPRWSIIRTNREQSVAEHTLFTVVYADQVADLMGWNGPREHLMRYALYHDADESFSGDMPTPGKRVIQKSSPEAWESFEKWISDMLADRLPDAFASRNLPESWKVEIKLITKVADLLEAAFFLADEEYSGNKNVVAVRNYIEDGLRKAIRVLCEKSVGAEDMEHAEDKMREILFKSIEDSFRPSRLVS